MNNKVFWVIVGFVILASYTLVFYGFMRSGDKFTTQPLGASGEPISPKPSLGANTTKTVTTTASTVFAAKFDAQLRDCTNTGAYDVTLSPTTTSLAAGQGFVLRASTSKTWVGDELYTGAIYGIAGATTTLACLEI